MRPLYRLAKTLTYAIFHIVGGRVVNANRIREWDGGIIAANHISYFDPPWVGCVWSNEIHFLAKRELFEVKLLSPLIKYLNAVPIRRGVIDRQSTARVKQIVESGKSILMFPEGSRKKFTAKPGIGKIAIQSGASVLPVLLCNTGKPCSSLLGRRPMRIVVGEPITREAIGKYEDTKDDYRALSEYILQRILALSEKRLSSDEPRTEPKDDSC
ncbi:MAG: 1-acyl-sn-glycerol-3-phosphate acyltransferase [Candidatus Cloacimonetes bacterium]|nr:1-acyl-sn-glycerol-3-phosphate acyltransferase [Candidatus Cloacimonadota bacterium]